MAQTKHKRTAIEFAKYYLAGSAFFWSAYGVFILLFTILNVNYAVAKVVSALVGNVINYALEKYWVFGKNNRKRETKIELFRYISFQIMNFLIDYLLVFYLWVSFGLRPEIGTFVAAGFFTVWTYLGFKFWVFRSSKKSLKPATEISNVSSRASK